MGVFRTDWHQEKLNIDRHRKERRKVEKVLMKTCVLLILFHERITLRCRTAPLLDSIAFITGQGKMWTLEKAAGRIIGQCQRKEAECRNVTIKQDIFPRQPIRST